MTEKLTYTPVLVYLRGGGLLDCRFTEDNLATIVHGSACEHIHVLVATGRLAWITIASIDAIVY